MQKIHYLQQKKLNPADELRATLSSLEERQPGIKSMNSTQALILLRDLDQAYTLFGQLESTSLSLLPEEGRFKTIQSDLKKKAGIILKALGGAVVLAEYRPKPAPSHDRWWWYIHERVAAQQKQVLRRVGINSIIIIMLIGGVILAFNTILAPSPETIISFEVENAANFAAEQGDYRTALAIIDEGLVKLPDDPGFLIYKGVLHQILGEEAAQTFDRARVQIADPLIFYIARSQLHLRLNQPEQAELDAKTVLELDENVARAWLLLGQSLQLQGREFEAIPAYEKAGQLALESGDNEIVVLARLALGQIGAGP